MQSVAKENQSSKFKSGSLVKVRVKGLNYINDNGFSTLSHVAGNFALYEFIDLISYPSTNDFYGYMVPVADGEAAMVLKYVGRPARISRDPKWFCYDVYLLLVAGRKCMAFGQNLELIS